VKEKWPNRFLIYGFRTIKCNCCGWFRVCFSWFRWSSPLPPHSRSSFSLISNRSFTQFERIYQLTWWLMKLNYRGGSKVVAWCGVAWGGKRQQLVEGKWSEKDIKSCNWVTESETLSNSWPKPKRSERHIHAWFDRESHVSLHTTHTHTHTRLQKNLIKTLADAILPPA